MNPNPKKRVGSALELPFEDGSFDVVVATTMTHHLAGDEEVIRHFLEADRVARRLVLVCDMQRNPVFLVLLGMLLVAKGAPREFRRDGLLSVRRGWRAGEWRELVERAGLTGARVWSEHGSRVLMARVKGGGGGNGVG
jgi:SAM-dependent methyltransferase